VLSDATLTGLSASNEIVSANVNFSASGSQTALVLRYSGPGDSNMYAADAYANGIYLYKNIGGAWTLLGSTTVSATSGTMQFSAIGTTLTVSFNGNEVIQALDSS